MNAISVSYRFSRQELSTLLQALRIGMIPGAPLDPVDEDTGREVLTRISEEGVAMIIDGTLYVDRVTDFLLRAAAGAKAAALLTDGSRTTVLWAAGKLCILGSFPDQGECALTPLQNLQAVEGALVDEIRHLARPLWGVSVFDQERRLSFAADDAGNDAKIAEAFLRLL